MSRRRTYDIPAQEMFRVDGPLILHKFTYDIEEAREAAEHRRRRKGELALSKRTQGFRSKTQNLWVPHSGIESSSAVKHPFAYVLQSKLFIREKVNEKYRDSEISPERVKLWAFFASKRNERELWDKYKKFSIDARESWLRLHWALGPEGEVERDVIEENDLAYGALKQYLVCLRVFVGQDDTLDKRGRRIWPQERHHARMARLLGWAATYLDALPAYEFDETFKEAYYSERSRYMYWTNTWNAYGQFRREENMRIARERPLTPLPVLATDRRADPVYYLPDGTFVG